MPQSFQLAFWIMIAVLLGILTFVLFIRLPSYGASLEGSWQDKGSSTPFVFKARTNQNLNQQLSAGQEVIIVWDEQSLLPPSKGYLIAYSVLQDESSKMEWEIHLNTTQGIPVGTSGTARVVNPKQSFLSLFWIWLKGK
ncbi:MAG: hypothetical protein KC422_23795 [Trueperaceae bacterium]|nr:hypothetical protein [Trueperaceae bacterium]